MHRLLAAILFFFTSMTASESPWAAYRFAPDASVEIDLAGDTGWTLAIDDGAKRPIKVPAGGWNSDRQEPQIPNKAVDDHVTYERTLDIPASAKDQAVKLHVGGCNFGAEVWIGERKIMTHYAPMTPFTADLTEVVQPGKSCLLRVVAYNRKQDRKSVV